MERLRRVCVASMSSAMMAVGTVVPAADDDIVVDLAATGAISLREEQGEEAVQVIRMRAVANRQVDGIRVINVNVIKGQQPATVDAQDRIDRWVFGADLQAAKAMMLDQIERRVRQLCSRYDLAAQKRAKLSLLARAELHRVLREADCLRDRYVAAAGNVKELNSIKREALALRQAQSDLLGPETFFAKAARTLLANEPIAAEYAQLDENQFHHHLLHIEAAINALDVIPLQQVQRDRLVELLLTVARPPKVPGRYDDCVAKYRLAMIPEETMLSILTRDQWRQATPILDGYRTFGPWLIQRGFVEAPSTEANSTTIRETTDAADAGLPANRLETR